MGNLYLMGTEFQVGKIKKFRRMYLVPQNYTNY